MAATFYTEPVLTFDLDVFILLQSESGGGPVSLDVIYQALRGRGYNAERETVSIEGVPVQFLPAYNALIEEALAQAMRSSNRRSHRRAKSITKVCPPASCRQNI